MRLPIASSPLSVAEYSYVTLHTVEMFPALYNDGYLERLLICVDGFHNDKE